MKRTITLTCLLLAIMLIAVFSCSKVKAKLQGPTDAQLFAWASDTAGRYYYKDDTVSILTNSGGSPHGPFKLRFNKIAHSVLGSDGKLPSNKTFPDSSLLVKVEHNGPAIIGYAVRFKLNGSWTWGEYSNTGQVYTGVSGNTNYCLSCHNGSNKDLVLTFVYH